MGEKLGWLFRYFMIRLWQAREVGWSIGLGEVIWLPMNYLDKMGAHTPIYPFIIPFRFSMKEECCFGLNFYLTLL